MASSRQHLASFCTNAPSPPCRISETFSIIRRTALETLRVDGLGFRDELMKELGQAENLGVSGLHITDAGLVHLRKLQHLQPLDIASTLVTREAAERLHRDYLPQCRITDKWCCGGMTSEPRGQ